MATKKCPNCGWQKDISTVICHCGFDFRTIQDEIPGPVDQPAQGNLKPFDDEQPIGVYRFPAGAFGYKQVLKIFAISLAFSFVIGWSYLFIGSLPFLFETAVMAPLFMALVIFITAVLVTRNLSELTLRIFPNRLEREDPKKKETYYWKDILQVEVKERKGGLIYSMKLDFSGGDVVALLGLDNMALAEQQIIQYIPDKDLVTRKRVQINWGNPVMIVLTGFIVLVMVPAFLESNEGAYWELIYWFYLWLGLDFLITRPMSSTRGTRWKTFENVMGGLLVLLSVILIVADIFS